MKAQEEQLQVIVPHGKPGQGWHCPSKTTLNLELFTSSPPMCCIAQSQALALFPKSHP